MVNVDCSNVIHISLTDIYKCPCGLISKLRMTFMGYIPVKVIWYVYLVCIAGIEVLFSS